MSSKIVTLAVTIAILLVALAIAVPAPGGKISATIPVEEKDVTGYVIPSGEESYLIAPVPFNIDEPTGIYINDRLADGKIVIRNGHAFVYVKVPPTSDKEYKISINTPRNSYVLNVRTPFSPAQVSDAYFIKYTVPTDKLSTLVVPGAGYEFRLTVNKKYPGVSVAEFDSGEIRPLKFNYEYIDLENGKYELDMVVYNLSKKSGNVIVWLGNFKSTGNEGIGNVDGGKTLSEQLAYARYVDYVIHKDYYIRLINAHFIASSWGRTYKGGDYFNAFIGTGYPVRRVTVHLPNGETIKAYTLKRGMLIVLSADDNRVYAFDIDNYHVDSIVSNVSMNEISEYTYQPYIGANYYYLVPYGENGKWDGVIAYAIEQHGGYKIVPLFTLDQYIRAIPKTTPIHVILSVYDTRGNGVRFGFSAVVIRHIDMNVLYIFHTSVNGVSTVFEQINASVRNPNSS